MSISMNRYRNAAGEVDAIQVTAENMAAFRLMGPNVYVTTYRDTGATFVEVTTPDGVVQMNDGDWIVRDADGEYHPCAAALFADSYEAAQS